MKTFSRLLVLLLMIAAVPAFAAERPVKGTKSYQAARTEAATPDALTAAIAVEGTEDVTQIAPAAGEAEEKRPMTSNTLREDMRLPRKN